MYGKKGLLLFILLVSFVMIGCANVDQQTESIKDDDPSVETFSEDISSNQINEIKADCLNYLIASGVNDATIEDIFAKMLDEMGKKLEPYKDKLENIDKNLTSLIAQKKTDANCNGLSFLF